MNNIDQNRLHNLILSKLNSVLISDYPWLYLELLEYILQGYRLKVEDANSYAIRKLIDPDDFVYRSDLELQEINKLRKFLGE